MIDDQESKQNDHTHKILVTNAYTGRLRGLKNIVKTWLKYITGQCGNYNRVCNRPAGIGVRVRIN